jgi:hypothetical protein
VPITTDSGFGQKGAIVKITAISGFATFDVNVTAVALRAHAFMDLIPTGFWVFLLVQHGGENARQVEIGRDGAMRTARTWQGFIAFSERACAPA